MADTLDEIAAVLNELREELNGSEAKFPDTPLKFTAGLALVLSAFDMALAMTTLLRTSPASGWVSAHVLHRPQFEHLIRGLFFLGPATEKEAETFLRSSALPKRTNEVSTGKNRRKEQQPITHAQMVEEVSEHFGFSKNLASSNAATRDPGHELVHGGRTIVGIYFHDGHLGPAPVSEVNIVGMLCNPLVVALAAFTVLPDMGFESLRNERVNSLLERGQAVLAVAAECLDRSTNAGHAPDMSDASRSTGGSEAR